MTLWQGIKLYPKAVAWSVLISTCICMEGYDVCLLSNFCECVSVSEGGGLGDIRLEEEGGEGEQVHKRGRYAREKVLAKICENKESMHGRDGLGEDMRM